MANLLHLGQIDLIPTRKRPFSASTPATPAPDTVITQDHLPRSLPGPPGASLPATPPAGHTAARPDRVAGLAPRRRVRRQQVQHPGKRRRPRRGARVLEAGQPVVPARRQLGCASGAGVLAVAGLTGRSCLAIRGVPTGPASCAATLRLVPSGLQDTLARADWASCRA